MNLREVNFQKHIKKQRHHFADKGPQSQSYSFFSSHLWMWELDHKENLVPKNWGFWTVILEKTLESPLDCKEIKPWIFMERTYTEVEVSILWPPDAKSWLIRKDPDAGKDWRQKKGMTKDEMVGWHHWFNGQKFEQIPGNSEGQGGVAFCSPLGRKEWATKQQQQSFKHVFKAVKCQHQ